VLLQHLEEMLWVFVPYVFYTKIIHHQGELNGSPDVLPQAWDKLALVVAVGV
jgi:hypothetical protein